MDNDIGSIGNEGGGSDDRKPGEDKLARSAEVQGYSNTLVRIAFDLLR